jgi:hypothetical protein
VAAAAHLGFRGRVRTLILVTLILSIAGCLCVPSQASCDNRPAGEATCVDLLTNRNNQLAPTLQALCVGTFSTSTMCDRQGSLGGCLCDGCENGRSITWFYPSADAGVTSTADVMKKCSDGHPFQSP